MYKWLNDRKISSFRDNLKYLLDTLKQDNINKLIMNNYGLSLSNQYWFLPLKTMIKWNEINFLNNSYDGNSFMKATFGIEALDYLKFDQNPFNK